MKTNGRPTTNGKHTAPAARNILGGALASCSTTPMTGFYRTGCCDTGPDDDGRHVVCAQVTAAFLAFSRARGNDLSTPRSEYGFPGLRPRRPLVPLRGPLAGGAGSGCRPASGARRHSRGGARGRPARGSTAEAPRWTLEHIRT